MLAGCHTSAVAQWQAWAMRLVAAILAIALLAASPVRAELRKVSQTELAAMHARLAAHWHPDKSIFSQPDQYVVVVRFRLDRDGRLSGPLQVISTGSGPLYQSTAEAAKRAIVLSQPFDMFSPFTYDAWKELEISFSPRAMAVAPSR
jgi:hypothetical protein